MSRRHSRREAAGYASAHPSGGRVRQLDSGVHIIDLVGGCAIGRQGIHMSLPLSTTADLSEEENPAEDRQQRLIREFLEFFTRRAPGFFVEVGANHPRNGSQTWHLEQRGWRGVLVEPLPEHAERLRRARAAKVFAVACSSPENAGRVLPFYASDALSGLDRERMAPWARPEVINVPVRTLDSLLEEAGAPRPLDFLSVDVEGHEVEVLRGFDFDRWAPRFILLEDHVANLSRHRFMKAQGYRLVRRTELNGWYVPASAPIRFGLGEDLRLLRKYYLGLPVRVMRHRLRGMLFDSSNQPHAPG
jgi:FkbM family methyltransferase